VKIVSGFGISNEVVTSAKELHIALQRIHPTLHVIVAKMPERIVNAVRIQGVFQEFSRLVSSQQA
jgi:hypothetical protein